MVLNSLKVAPAAWSHFSSPEQKIVGSNLAREQVFRSLFVILSMYLSEINEKRYRIHKKNMYM
jgi:hypothetical protein